MTKKFLVFFLALSLFPGAVLSAAEQSTSSFFNRARRVQEVREQAMPEPAPVPAPPSRVEEEKPAAPEIVKVEEQKGLLAGPRPVVPRESAHDPRRAVPKIPEAVVKPEANKGFVVGAPSAPKAWVPAAPPKVPAAPKTPPAPPKKQR